MVNVMGVDQKEKLQYSVYNEKYSPGLNFVEIFFAIVLQGVCLTVARSPVASAYRLGLVERPSPLARLASDHDIRFLQ